jgi:ketosteroid isomerase-like protein
MAAANVELVRSLYAAWERGDRSSIEWAHPEIEFVIADRPAPGSGTGLAGMTKGFRDLLSGFEEWRPQADAHRQLDGERVLVLDRFSGRGKTSGLDIGQMRTEGAVLFHLRGGRVTKAVSTGCPWRAVWGHPASGGADEEPRGAPALRQRGYVGDALARTGEGLKPLTIR